MHKKTKKSPRDLPNNLPSTPKQTSKKKNSSRPSWKIQRGYSSGVSSCGSESGDSGEDSLPLTGDSDGVGELQNRDRLVSDMSRHSDILALSMLRQTNASDGDLAKAVVRIEVSSNL